MNLAAETQGAFCPTQVFLVGGEGYVAREWKRRFAAMGIGVAGHAPKAWRPPFAPPKWTTHLFVIEDDIGPALREAAHRLSTEQRIPLIEAPARNRPVETMELLAKEGLVDQQAETPAPAQETPVATAPQPPAETPPTTTSTAAGEPHMDNPTAFAQRLLRETDGKITDRIASEIVAQKTKQALSPEAVAKLRRAGKFPTAQVGKRPKALNDVLAKYGYEVKPHAEASKPAKPNGVAHMNGQGQEEEEHLQRAVLVAIRGIEEKVLAPFAVSRFVLVYEDGQWHDPEIERLAPTRTTLKLPKRVPAQRR